MPSPRKIAVAGATGRVGRHAADVLTERGYEVVPMSRALGVDVITGDGLAGALVTEVAWREENLAEMARLLAAHRGHPAKIEEVTDPADPTTSSTKTAPCCPAPAPSSAGPRSPNGSPPGRDRRGVTAGRGHRRSCARQRKPCRPPNRSG